MALALLIFLPSLVFVPHYAYTLGLFFTPRKITLDLNLIVISLIIIISIINNLLNFNNAILYDKSLNTLFPYTILLYITFFVAKSIDQKVIDYLLFLVLFESLIAILEFIFRTPTFFKSFVTTELSTNYGLKGLLYYHRTFGMSNNSSELSFKIFSAILLLFSSQQKKTKKIIYFVIFILGLFATFNRTAILGLTLFFILFYYHYLIQFYQIFRLKIKHAIFFLFLIILVFLIIHNFGTIKLQFTRGGMNTSLDAFKRLEILNFYINFIQEHPLFGNGSFKLFHLFMGRLFHAHNSFIQVAATHGLIIMGLYLFLILKNITRNNYKFILPFLVVSISQYVIFWGISFADIVFFYFLIQYNKNDTACNPDLSYKK